MDATTAELLLTLRDLHTDGLMEEVYNCTPYTDIEGLGEEGPPLEEALHAWAQAGYPDTGRAAEVERLTAELEEARLTLAAEQGRAEGAPSEGWTYGIIDDEGGQGWRKPWRHGMIFAWGIGCYVSSSAVVTPHPGGWSRWRYNDDGELDEEVEHHTDDGWTMRAAMRAADAASSTPPASPE